MRVICLQLDNDGSEVWTPVVLTLKLSTPYTLDRRLGELESRLGSSDEDRSFLLQLRIEPQLSEMYPVACIQDLSPGSQTRGLLLRRITYISLLSCSNKAPKLLVTRFKLPT